MILILTEDGTEPAAQALAAALTAEYSLANAPAIVPSGAVWARSVEWDDLLLVVYKSGTLAPSAAQYIQAYRDAHKTVGGIIPVGTNPAFLVPPNPISGIKAGLWDGSPERTARIVKSAGVFLGLAFRPGSQRIFVAYPASDGEALAKAIHDRLQFEGFNPWLDVAKENIAVGDDVQEEIRRSIDTAAMILLVDTPDAPASKWISIEIDMAISQLVPVLPIVIGDERTSRFIQLQSLRRQVVVGQNGPGAQPLSDAEWDEVLNEVGQLLLSAYRRRLKILSRAQSAFKENGFQWHVLDERLRMYRADKNMGLMGKVVTLSHCLVHDITYLPALKAYWRYLKTYADLAAVNQKLCIYDRDRVLSEAEMETLKNNLPDMNPILAHYNELELLLASNFTALRK